MKQTELIMGMPISVEIIGSPPDKNFAAIFSYFKEVDARYSTYRPDSEISQINNGLPRDKWSSEMLSVFTLCEQTGQQTKGYFNILHNGKYDPSGLVKGWAVNNAANMLIKTGVGNFCIEAGGDIQVHGTGDGGQPWRVGIRSPFDVGEVIKTVTVSTEGIATSGTYIRGQHIYNPIQPTCRTDKVKSLTVIGSDVYEADRYATAAFAMGEYGIAFIESVKSLEGFMVDNNRMATYTSGFEKYVT